MLCWVLPQALLHAAFRLLKSGDNVGKIVICSPFSSTVRIRNAPVQSARADEVTRASATRPTLGITSIIEVAQEIAKCRIDADAPLMDAGVDSLGGVELRNQLQHAAGVTLPSTLMFDHPTVRQLARLFDEHASKAQGATGPPPLASRGLEAEQPCIVALSGLLPGAQSVRAASALARCSNCIRESPVQM